MQNKESKFSKKKFFICILCVFVLGIILQQINTPKMAPNISFKLLVDSGQIGKNTPQKSLSLKDFTGKITMVHFWATGCPACITEMPKLINLYKKFENKLEIIAIAMEYDLPLYVSNYIKQNNVPFKVAIDSTGSSARAFNVQVIPTTFLLDKHGLLLKQYTGEPNWLTLHKLLTEIS